MKKGVLFLNGAPPDTDALIGAQVAKRGGASVYCTDGAYSYVSRVFLPDAVVGDFDSIDEDIVDVSCEKISFPSEKDFTDGFLALKEMISRGIDDIEIFGAYGGRPDMEESNYMLLALALKSGVSAVMRGEFSTYMINTSFVSNVKKGAIVSLVPFTDSVHILYTKGLKYALCDYTMNRFEGIEKDNFIMGVSNLSVSERIEIGIDDGAALVFVQQGR